MQLTPAQIAASNAHYEATLAEVKEFCAANDLNSIYEAIAPIPSATPDNEPTLGDLFVEFDAFVAERPYLSE